MKKLNKQINLAIILGGVQIIFCAFVLGVMFATPVKAESIEQWCKNGRDGEKYIGASIGALACVAAFPVGCVAIPVGYVVPQLTSSDVKGCVKNRKKELGVK